MAFTFCAKKLFYSVLFGILLTLPLV